jgi:hypothetical protein
LSKKSTSKKRVSKSRKCEEDRPFIIYIVLFAVSAMVLGTTIVFWILDQLLVVQPILVLGLVGITIEESIIVWAFWISLPLTILFLVLWINRLGKCRIN